MRGLRLQFGKHRAQRLDHRGHHRVDERPLGAQILVAHARGAAQDAAQHIVAAVGTGRRTIGDGAAEAAHVIGHHAIGDVDVVLQLAAVGARAGGLLDGREQRRPQIGVVVAALVLQHADQALEAHARVHMLRGQRLQRAALLAVELDEHQVPDLQHIGVAAVHLLGGVAPADAIEVDLAARAARTRLAHLPEVVLHVAGNHVIFRQELAPQRACLQVGFQSRFLVAAEVRGVQTILGQAVHAGEQFPRPLDRLLLEVVAEAPVAQHLEERVVIHVAAHILEVVVLAAGADALLRVHGPRVRTRSATQEHVLELVHACVGEQQGGVVQRHHGA